MSAGLAGGVKRKEGRADELFREYRDSVCQVRVIETASGKKRAIGSAFCVNADGRLVTNYHVVSMAIHDSHLYRLECVMSDGRAAPLDILGIDVVHDLAIVQCPEEMQHAMALGESSLDKGTDIFSLGNPMDLGMVIVDGTYNGLLKKSFYEKILFSGSLNPGMSGGPAINSEGEVIGINVSTHGQQISFLVPVEYLKKLLDGIDEDGPVEQSDFHNIIERQLFENQKRCMKRLLESEWVLDELGDARVPRIDDIGLHSWGDAEDDKEVLYDRNSMVIYAKDYIYVEPKFLTGQIKYRVDWYVSKGLIAPRFYKRFSHAFGRTMSMNRADRDNVTDFEEHEGFVNIDGRDCRVVFCARKYKKYPSLYDVVVEIASLGEMDRGLLVDIILSGVSREMGQAFVRKFMEEMSWRN